MQQFPAQTQSLWLSVLVFIAALSSQNKFYNRTLVVEVVGGGVGCEETVQTFNFHFPPGLFSQHQSNPELIPDHGRWWDIQTSKNIYVLLCVLQNYLAYWDRG